jgi:para-nitrobenzyl esterase
MRVLPSSEDCLYLNVITPAKKANAKLPVMVWFHGGGTRYGNGNLPISNSLGLPSHGVVLVTINHRLGIFSLFAHPLLSCKSPHGVSGNYLFLDLIASLKWIKNNIAAFGGDPDNVTIFGQSGGGIKVLAMMISPQAKGLFHKAIIQSGGNYVEPYYLKDLEKHGEKFFAKLGVSKNKDPLAAARAIPFEKIIEYEQAFNVELGREYEFMGPWCQVVDGWFMPDSILNTFQTGKWNQVPLMAVGNMGEITGPSQVIADKLINNYVSMLEASGKVNSGGYAIIFDQVPGNWRREGCVSAHGMELHYMFGSLDVTEGWEAHYGGFHLSGAKSPVPTISSTDRKISEAMINIWTQFARTGNPNVKELIEWPAWDKAGDHYLYINDSLQVKSGYSDLAKIKTIQAGML